MLTDVEGIETRSEPERRLIEEVNSNNAAYALSQCEASEKPDITGGMRTKLKSLLAAASEGVESIICDGRKTSALREAIFLDGPQHIGTNVRAG